MENNINTQSNARILEERLRQEELDREAQDRRTESSRKDADSVKAANVKADNIKDDVRKEESRKVDDRRKDDRRDEERPLEPHVDRGAEEDRRFEVSEVNKVTQGESLAKLAGVDGKEQGHTEVPTPDQSRAGTNVLNPDDLARQESRENVNRPQAEKLHVQSAVMSPEQARLERGHKANAANNVAISDRTMEASLQKANGQDQHGSSALATRLHQRAEEAESKAQSAGKTLPPERTQDFAVDTDTQIQAHEMNQAEKAKLQTQQAQSKQQELTN